MSEITRLRVGIAVGCLVPDTNGVIYGRCFSFVSISPSTYLTVELPTRVAAPFISFVLWLASDACLWPGAGTPPGSPTISVGGRIPRYNMRHQTQQGVPVFFVSYVAHKNVHA